MKLSRGKKYGEEDDPGDGYIHRGVKKQVWPRHETTMERCCSQSKCIGNTVIFNLLILQPFNTAPHI